jgi:hypothetical protein
MCSVSDVSGVHSASNFRVQVSGVGQWAFTNSTRLDPEDGGNIYLRNTVQTAYIHILGNRKAESTEMSIHSGDLRFIVTHLLACARLQDVTLIWAQNYWAFSAQADWTLTHTEQSTIEASITFWLRNRDWLTAQVITEWMTFSLPGDTTVSADKMFWTSNKPAKWTIYTFSLIL